AEDLRKLPNPSLSFRKGLQFPSFLPSISFRKLPFLSRIRFFSRLCGRMEEKKRRNRVCSAPTPNRGAGNGARQSGAALPGRDRKQDTRMCWRFIERTLQRVSILSRQSCARAGQSIEHLSRLTPPPPPGPRLRAPGRRLLWGRIEEGGRAQPCSVRAFPLPHCKGRRDPPPLPAPTRGAGARAKLCRVASLDCPVGSERVGLTELPKRPTVCSTSRRPLECNGMAEVDNSLMLSMPKELQADMRQNRTMLLQVVDLLRRH